MNNLADRDTRNRAQRDYYNRSSLRRMRVAATPYVDRHVEEMLAGAELDPGQEILEVGAGLGKFTVPLTTRGYRITANELSPELLAGLRGRIPVEIPTLRCDIHEIDRRTDSRFDRVIGFFVLHHLTDFDALFATLARVMRPGGVIAFAEPVGTNPLYVLQVALTPTMRFAGEPSLRLMRREIVLPALTGAGFVQAASREYGYFPPAVVNRAAGARAERWLESRRRVPFPHAFQLFTARLPG